MTDWCPPRRGGIEGQVAGLARALAARGHAVHLFTTTRNPCAIPGVDVHAIETAMVGEVAAPALWKVRELRRLLVECGLDVVHAHGMFSTLAIGSLLAAHGARLPSVTTHHSLLRQSPTLPAAWFTYRLFSRCATIVTAVSRAAADDARRASGRPDVEVLPNGLDRTMWRTGGAESRGRGSVCRQSDPRPQASRNDASPARVVSVMRLAAKKSPGDLIDSVPVVLARARCDVVFSIVGDGPERANLERRARRLGVESHVEFLGACDPPRVAGVLARSTLFALPSAREAFGIAILEARAAGLPIVARASGGVPEIVEHGRQGLLVQASPNTRFARGSAGQALGDAIVTLLNDEALREGCSAASADGLDAYDWDCIVDGHETVYRRAIAVLGCKG